LAGVQACKYNLHGRIIWPKGSTLGWGYLFLERVTMNSHFILLKTLEEFRAGLLKVF